MLGQLVLAVASLAAIILLILGAGMAARRFPALMKPGEQGVLSLRGSLSLDARRRLHLVEVGGQSALVLTGGTSDVMLLLPQPGP